MKDSLKQTGLEYDVCIIGAGMMGLVLANELKETGKKICVIESGFLDLGSKQKKVESTDLQIKDITRERGLGGSSQTWWGLTGLLDEYDLAKQSASDFSGWPIKYKELIGYCRKAANTYDFPNLELYFNENYRTTAVTGEEELTGEVFAAKTSPLRFGEHFESLFKLPNINLVNNVTVTEILIDNSGERASGVNCVNKAGEKKEITSKVVVLASGGIENSRLLLLSNSTQKNGLGNTNDQVGRYFMNHPKGFYGAIKNINFNKIRNHFLSKNKDIRSYVGISISGKERRKSNLLHPYVQLCPEYPWSGNQTFSLLIDLRNKALRRTVTREGFSSYDGISKKNLIPDIIFGVYYFVLVGFMKIFGIKYPITSARIRNYVDMAPRPDNRIILSECEDEYGMLNAKVIMNLDEKEKKSLVYLHEMLKRVISRNKLGEMESNLGFETKWPIITDAAHHMGGTRMGNDPKTSVVNSDLQIHGIKNVFVAGTSVMPTGGNMNPSLIGVALTVKLAEHLKTSV